jgi:hypothetical protein
MSIPSTRRSLLDLARPGWDAVVKNWRPFIAIQSVAVLVAAAYYLAPGVAPHLARLAEFKARAGIGFAAISTAAAGVILPEIAKRVTMRSGTPMLDLTFQAGLYATIGATVDLLYTFLAQLLGATASPIIVLEKVSLDMFVYTPLVSIPISTVAFIWKDQRFSSRATIGSIRSGEFRARYPSILVTCWGFWVPVLAAVYSMPANLQFMLFLCAQGAWSILLVVVAAGNGSAVPSDGA